jgi:uncharacterized protein (TIGR02001 family)
MGLITICAGGVALAQTQPAAATDNPPPKQEAQPTPPADAGTQQAQTSPTPPPAEKETWKAPFGGTWAATFAFVTDYSYRGISQTQRQVAGQMAFGYESAPVSENVPLTAYVGAWGSSVYFPNTGTVAEIDLLAGLKLKTFGDKLTFDLGYTRYNYLGAPSNLFYDFNEFGLVVGYDFGVAQVSGAVRYSPNFYANSGIAWYKWGQVAVPIPYTFNENVAFKVFGTIGNQYVERFVNYAIGNNNYWDWQIGFTATVYGFDLTIAYVDTNLDVPNCGNTMNCDARAIFTVSKTF